MTGCAQCQMPQQFSTHRPASECGCNGAAQKEHHIYQPPRWDIWYLQHECLEPDCENGVIASYSSPQQALAHLAVIIQHRTREDEGDEIMDAGDEGIWIWDTETSFSARVEYASGVVTILEQTTVATCFDPTPLSAGWLAG